MNSQTRFITVCVGVSIWFAVLGVGGTQAAEDGLKASLRWIPFAPASDENARLIRGKVTSPGPAADLSAEVRIPGRDPVRVSLGRLEAGERTVEIAVPAVKQETMATVVLRAGNLVHQVPVKLHVGRKWRFFLVQNTHTDIGYTDRPSVLAAAFVRFIDDAVQFCADTDDYPDDAKFRWVCEGTWAVEWFLRDRPPARREEFLRRVREGRIEVTGLQMNLGGSAPEEVVRRSLLPIRRLREQYGIPIRTAMQCDVNGFPWDLPEMCSEIGIEALAAGINVTRSVPVFPFNRGITWESPGGGQMIAWRGEHYHFGNQRGFIDNVDVVLDKLPPELQRFEELGYPYDALYIQHAGYHTDNSPPNVKVSDLVKEWNERFSWPKLRFATLSEFIDYVKENKADLPVYRKAWPDWWCDGNGSAARRLGVVREAEEGLLRASTAWATVRAGRAKQFADPRKSFAQGYEEAAIYNEHTFGASSSISSPGSLNTRTQWGEKAARAEGAQWIATQLEASGLEAICAEIPTGDEPVIAVFNMTGWPATGPVIARVGKNVVSADQPFQLVDVGTGKEVPVQYLGQRADYRRYAFVAKDVPPLGYRTLRILRGKKPTEDKPACKTTGPSITNGVTLVGVDPATGAIAELVDSRVGSNVVTKDGPYGFNQYIYEQIIDPPASGNMMERQKQGLGRRLLWPKRPYDPKRWKRTVLTNVKVEAGASGPVFGELRVSGDLVTDGAVARPGLSGKHRVVSTITLYRDVPFVAIDNRVYKPRTTEPEACYFAFPFKATGAMRVDTNGGVMRPGADQVPDSSSDWHQIERWARASNSEFGAVWTTLDAALVQFGGLNMGHYVDGLTLDKPVAYSFAMNNYWFTNFKAAQGGEFRFRYAVLAHRGPGRDVDAERFARQRGAQLQAYCVHAKRQGPPPASASLLSVEPDNLSVAAVKETEFEDGALIVRVRENEGRDTDATLRFGSFVRPVSAARTDVLENARDKLTVEGSTVRAKAKALSTTNVLVRVKR